MHVNASTNRNQISLGLQFWSPDIGAGNQAQVFRKSNVCSQTLSQISSLIGDLSEALKFRYCIVL